MKIFGLETNKQWLTSLQDRIFEVRINGQLTTQSGVPQGLVLGPIFYHLHTIDILYIPQAL